MTSEEAVLLTGLLDRAGFRGRRVVLVAPREAMLSATLELPPRSSGAPIEQLARMELARTHKCDPGSFELGVWDLPAPGREGGQSHVFAAALPVEKSIEALDVLENAGLEVVAVDIPACALARGVSGPNSPGAVLDVGWAGAMLVVLHQGVVVYERMIEEASLSKLFDAAQTRAGMSPETVEPVLLHQPSAAQAAEYAALFEPLRGVVGEYLDVLAAEVQRSLAYVAHRYGSWALRRMVAAGDGAALQGLSARLGAALEVECTVGDGAAAGPANAAMLCCMGAARFGEAARAGRAA